MHPPFKREVANSGAADGVGMSITMQPEAPLLLGPGPRQRTCKRRDGQARRRGAVEQPRDDPWREERERQQQPDVPLDLSFSTSDHGETRSAAVRQVVDPLAGGTWMMPFTTAGTGLVQGTVIVVMFAMGGADEALVAEFCACAAWTL